MSETIIEPVEFKSKGGTDYILIYRDGFWKVFIFPANRTSMCISAFKLQSKAIEFCERLKESE